MFCSNISLLVIEILPRTKYIFDNFVAMFFLHSLNYYVYMKRVSTKSNDHLSKLTKNHEGNERNHQSQTVLPIRYYWSRQCCHIS